MIVYDYICMTCRPMQQNKRNNQLTKKSTNWVSLAFLPVMASNGTLNPTSSWIYPRLFLSDRGLSLLSTIINDDVLTFFGSWSTTIVDKRVVPTSSISFSAATDTPSLWKISSLYDRRLELWGQSWERPCTSLNSLKDAQRYSKTDNSNAVGSK